MPSKLIKWGSGLLSNKIEPKQTPRNAIAKGVSYRSQQSVDCTESSTFDRWGVTQQAASSRGCSAQLCGGYTSPSTRAVPACVDMYYIHDVELRIQGVTVNVVE